MLPTCRRLHIILPVFARMRLWSTPSLRSTPGVEGCGVTPTTTFRQDHRKIGPRVAPPPRKPTAHRACASWPSCDHTLRAPATSADLRTRCSVAGACSSGTPTLCTRLRACTLSARSRAYYRMANPLQLQALCIVQQPPSGRRSSALRSGTGTSRPQSRCRRRTRPGGRQR